MKQCNPLSFGISALVPVLGLLVSAAASAAPVKIGVLETLSGPQASSGQAYRSAVRYAIEQINAAGGWNGEPVQLLEYDNQGGPTGAADKLRTAAADGVHMVVQGASSAIGGQITEDVRKYNLRNPGKEMVYINVGAEALELTLQRRRADPHQGARQRHEAGQRAGLARLLDQPELFLGPGHGARHLRQREGRRLRGG
jgi:branched-chain amino acid transport system substrate-binding protein